MIYLFIHATHLHYHTLVHVPAVQSLSVKTTQTRHSKGRLQQDGLESKANLSYSTEFQANLGFKARARFRGWGGGETNLIILLHIYIYIDTHHL